MSHEQGTHFLIAFPFFKGITGAVSIFIKCQGTSWKFLFYIVLNNSFLVFYGGIVPVHLLVYRDTAIPRNIISFCQCSHLFFSLASVYHGFSYTCIRKYWIKSRLSAGGFFYDLLLIIAPFLSAPDHNYGEAIPLS